jgi:hypothetical protein
MEPTLVLHDRKTCRFAMNALLGAVIERLARRGVRVHAHAFDPLPGTPWSGAAPGAIDGATSALLALLHGSGRAYGRAC